MALRVCYFGTYRAEYSRNQIMIAALRTAGVEVIECHVPLWHSIQDRVEIASGGWASPRFAGRIFSTYGRLLQRYFSLRGQFDVLMLGYPGQLDVFLARPLAWLYRKPLAMDMFMSIYLIAKERNLHQRSGLSIALLRALEWLAIRLPDALICDTPAYARWHQHTHGLPAERFNLVPTGADDRVFQPLEAPESDSTRLKVLYYGTFISNHGVATMIEAARLLQDQPHFHFEFIGTGPERDHAQKLAEQYALRNVTFTDWVDKADLPQRIAEADILLGVFGLTPQSLMTVQNKLYEGLAMRKPIISGVSPMVQAQLGHGHALYLVERNHPRALADGLRVLAASPSLRRRLAEQGHAEFMAYYGIEKLGQQFKAHLQNLVATRQRAS